MAPDTEALRLTEQDLESLAGTAFALFDSASDGFEPDRTEIDPATNSGRYMFSRALWGLVAQGLAHRAPMLAQLDCDHALKIGRTAKSRALCLRNMGVRAAAEDELRAIARYQAELRDPDQSETWIALSNLYLSQEDPEKATQAACLAVGAAHSDGWAERMREALAEAGVAQTDIAATRAVGLRLHRQIGHWYPEPTRKLLQNALMQLETTTESLIEATLESDPARASQERHKVIELTQRLLGPADTATLTRTAVLCNNNARQWMQVQNWQTAFHEMNRAIDAAHSAQLDAGTLAFLDARRQSCRDALDAPETGA